MLQPVEDVLERADEELRRTKVVIVVSVVFHDLQEEIELRLGHGRHVDQLQLLASPVSSQAEQAQARRDDLEPVPPGLVRVDHELSQPRGCRGIDLLQTPAAFQFKQLEVMAPVDDIPEHVLAQLHLTHRQLPKMMPVEEHIPCQGILVYKNLGVTVT